MDRNNNKSDRPEFTEDQQNTNTEKNKKNKQ